MSLLAAVLILLQIVGGLLSSRPASLVVATVGTVVSIGAWWRILRARDRSFAALDYFVLACFALAFVRYAAAPTWNGQTFVVDLFLGSASYAILRCTVRNERDVLPLISPLALLALGVSLSVLRASWQFSHEVATWSGANLAVFRGLLPSPFALLRTELATLLLAPVPARSKS